MSEILVVTCPSGKQCNHLIPLLYNKGKWKLRLAAHSQVSKDKLHSQYPDAEIIQVDLNSLHDCQTLLTGATTVYHVGPSFHSREREMGFNMIDAAVAETKRPGNVFKHFVFSGVMGTQIRNLMQHDLKSHVEERLYLSIELNWTILQPANFMNFFPIALLASQEQPVLDKLWNPEGANSMIALQDLAEAAAKVLNEGEQHYFAQYQLSSTLPIPETEVAKIVGKHLGKEVQTRAPTFEEGVGRALQYLFGGAAAEGEPRPDITRDEAERLILFSNRRGLRGSPNVLRWLLGREPTTLDEWIKTQMKIQSERQGA
ncbi:hypothetical protein J7T55_002628 [Diaporthe amygdali]|uniref:uncharacterized protein n=1 Tax=Phomopsis amygdali TaxID=1214568 RepID=UPI0022FF0982|nr:uncharacterized protein J7T55_002628 [Diaporthe amygdali]KAJ0122116.1 hypothetical protein J7T55_002628 [Diaporthe amygdali]